MKKIIILTFSLLLITYFTGCASSTDIRPSYNKNAKIVNIGNYKIKDVSYYNEKKSSLSINSMGNTGYLLKQIYAENGICDNIQIIEYEAKSNWFYYYSGKEIVLTKHKDNCNIETIGYNLNFLTCGDNYYLASSIRKDTGYGMMRIIKVKEACYKDMKDFFSQREKKPQKINTIKNTKVTTLDSSNDMEPFFLGFYDIETKYTFIEEDILVHNKTRKIYKIKQKHKFGLDLMLVKDYQFKPYEDISKSNKIDAKKSTTKEKNNKAYLIRFYEGTFVSTKASECASTGKIRLSTQNQNINGSIIYKYKGKYISSTLTGGIVNKNVAGNTENLQFVGTLKNNAIKGKYYGSKCEGLFNVKLVNTF